MSDTLRDQIAREVNWRWGAQNLQSCKKFVAALFDIPTIAVVELPEPESSGKPGGFSWSDRYVVAIDGRVEIDGHSMTPANARQLAAELLAAASHADNHVR